MPQREITCSFWAEREMSRKLAYISGAISYGILIVAYGKEYLLNLLAGFSPPLGSLVLIVFGWLPPVILIVMAFSESVMANRQENKSSVGWLEKIWRGDISLPIAFLVCNVFGALLITLIGQFLYFQLEKAPPFKILVLGSAFILFGLGYHIVSTVGTLRSSRQYSGSRIWVSMARFGVIWTSIFILLSLVLTALGFNIFMGIG